MKKVEETLFTSLMGNTPNSRVLELLILGKGFDYSLSDIVRGAHVSWVTVHRVVASLLKPNVIKHTRKVGAAKMYQINRESGSAKILIKLCMKTQLDHMNKIMTEQEGIKAKVK